MKALSALVIGVLSSAINPANALDLNSIDLDKARAYQAYVMTFAWPDNMSSETIEYEEVYSLDGLIQSPKRYASSMPPRSVPSPFERFQNTIRSQTQLLSLNSWTLIFPDKGASISKSFFSQAQQDGYPELSGRVTFTLERYLKSNLHYQHYQFGHPVTESQESPLVANSPQVQPTQGTWQGPSQVLTLNFVNKTASKKLNYIDHPVVGTLIYFEPLELEQAIDLASQR